MPPPPAAPGSPATPPSKNRSPATAGRSYVPIRQSGLPTTVPSHCPETRFQVPDGTPAATAATHWTHFPRPGPPPPPPPYLWTHFQPPRRFGHRNPLLQSPHRGQLEFFRELPS